MAETGLTRRRILELIGNGTITAEVGHALLRELPRAAPTTAATPARPMSRDVAVIGMSGRFPGAANLDDYWHNLRSSHDSVAEIPASRWDIAKHFDPNPLVPNKTYSKWGAVLEDVDRFDPDFFNMSPREARVMDPQQRIFLMEAWKALEDAGYSDRRLDEIECAVYVGCAKGDYRSLLERSGVPLEGYTFTGNDSAILAARISYQLNLRGPSIAIDTACSASLVAVHMACEAIREGKTEMALAGGVAALATPELHVLASKSGMLSPQGKCRAFDDGADGFVPGEGVGVIVLKSLERALRDGDHIHGVIAASGMNQDGRTNGITAPSGPSQTALEVDTYRRFQIDPGQITYVECHGTGTKLGDPIEIDALTRSFRSFTQQKQYCALGSVKTNIGHALTAAGIAGLLKVLLCLRHRTLVPSLHLEKLNRHIRLDGGPFYANTDVVPWSTRGAEARHAAVSAFGFSGTNAHVVVREAPQREETQAAAHDRRPRLIPLSAKTRPALEQKLRDLVAWLARDNGHTPLRDISYTLVDGRSHFSVRAAFVARDARQLRERLLRELGEDGDFAPPSAPNGAANELARLERVAAAYRGGEGLDPRVLFDDEACRRVPLPTYPFARERCWVPEVQSKAGRAESGAPGPGAIAVDARATLEQGGGVVIRRRLDPDEPIVREHQVEDRRVLPAVGHLALVHAAAREALGAERVSLSRVVWLKLLDVDPTSGSLDVLVQLRTVDEERLSFEVRTRGQDGAMRIHCRGEARRERPLENAFIALDDIRARCTHMVGGAQHYARFDAGVIRYGESFRTVQELVHDGRVEVLATLRSASSSKAEGPFPAGVLDGALQAIAALHPAQPGAQATLVPFAVDRVELLAPVPELSFAHVESPKPNGASDLRVTITDTAGRVCVRLEGLSFREVKAAGPAQKVGPELRVFAPEWRKLPGVVSSATPSARGRKVLIVTADGALGLDERIAAHHAGDDVVRISTTNVGSLRELASVELVYFLGGLEEGAIRELTLAALDASQERGVLSLYRLLKALGRRKDRPLSLKVVTNDVHASAADQRQRPAAASLFGLCKSLAKEWTSYALSVLDVASADVASDADAVALAIVSEPANARGDEVMLRGGARFGRVLRPLPAPPPARTPYRERGTYVVLGGAGGIGLELAMHLAKTVRARIVLLGRRELAEAQLAKVREIEAAGAEVLYLRVDATDEAAMRAAIATAKARFGAIHGAFHSAIVLRDRLLDMMDEETFVSALDPKTRASLVFADALAAEPLDFFVFFSSAQSFSGNPGQSNYSAGCTFKDAFADSLRTAGRPVHIVNWGYWGDVGIVAKDGYRKRMEALGVHSITTEEGMGALASVIAHGIPQAAPFKAEPHVLATLGVVEAEETEETAGPFEALAVHTGAELDVAEQRAAHAALDVLGARMLVMALKQMGALQRAGEAYESSSLAKRLSIASGHMRLWETLLAVLVEHGYATREGANIVTTAAVESVVEMPSQQEEKELVRRHPDVAAHVGLLSACLHAYPKVLRGELAATQVMFPGSSMELVQGIYQGNALADHHNALVARALRTLIEERAASGDQRVVRILEIGAGTGGTSALVFEQLRGLEKHVEYVYTDLSAGFLQFGKKRYGAIAPYALFQRLDIERPVGPQGFETRRFDAVVASNVLHATRHIRRTLHNTASLLAPGGWLVLNETTEFSAFATLTFGLLDGWWLSEDADQRLAGAPLLAIDGWQRALRDEGFGRIALLGKAASPADRPGQTVFVAERSADAAATANAATTSKVKAGSPERPPAKVTGNGNGNAGRPAHASAAVLRERVEQIVAEIISETLGRGGDDLDVDKPFNEYGVDSIILVELVGALNERLGVVMKTTALFDHPSARELSAFLAESFADDLQRTIGGAGGAAPAAPAAHAAPAGGDLAWLDQLAEGELTVEQAILLLGQNDG